MEPAISINPDIMSGTPVFPGTRVPVRVLWDFIEDGATVDEFLQSYDWISREMVIRVLESSYSNLVKPDEAA
ncbi:MAG: hypothetical protein QOJ65_1121 [Fimbriimonadaceae bacterium]|jgi:uncharacterized protein (DUF433 family)|nr:hypothetical protein [Fimbriimonadaceae bacterium]